MPTPPLPRRVAWFAPWTWRKRWWVGAAMLLVFVGYPLSIGPAYGLVVRGWIYPGVYNAVYLPLIWFLRLHPAMVSLLEWYAFLFLG